MHDSMITSISFTDRGLDTLVLRTKDGESARTTDRGVVVARPQYHTKMVMHTFYPWTSIFSVNYA